MVGGLGGRRDHGALALTWLFMMAAGLSHDAQRRHSVQAASGFVSVQVGIRFGRGFWMDLCPGGRATRPKAQRRNGEAIDCEWISQPSSIKRR